MHYSTKENSSIQTAQFEYGLERTRFSLILEYDGRALSGSQFQPMLPTVQGYVQEALIQLRLPASPVTFAGRMDAGVSALGQVAHFDLTSVNHLRAVNNLPLALNRYLPDSVSVRAVLPVSLEFHSRRDSVLKWYRYRIYNASSRSVWADRLGSTHIWKALDEKKMKSALQMLIGTHDFSSFMSAGAPVVDRKCTIFYTEVSKQDNFIEIDIVANRFLYKMVRNIVGQLVSIAQSDDSTESETILVALNSLDRRSVAATAPPDGLFLMAVLYPPHLNYFAQDSYLQQLETMLNPMKMEPLIHENLFRKAS